MARARVSRNLNCTTGTSSATSTGGQQPSLGICILLSEHTLAKVVNYDNEQDMILTNYPKSMSIGSHVLQNVYN